MPLRGERVFISGGNGVIGNALVDKLSRSGTTLYVGDLKPRPKHWSSHIRYRQGDLNYITREELADFAPTIFIHLAATFERSTESHDFWEENFHHNVTLSHYLMGLLKEMPSLKKVVFASSYLIYDPALYTFTTPANNAHCLKENDAIYPRNLTGVAKLSHEIELRFLEEFKRNIQFVSARIFRGYGLNSRDVISRWVRQLLRGETLTVYAKEGMFDYIYAEDTAEGLIRLAASVEAKGIINLGTGRARRVSEVLQILKKQFPEMRMTEVPSDIHYEASAANMDAFRKLIQWTPARQLEDTIPQIIDYEKGNKPSTPDEIKMNVLATSISRKVPMLKSVKNAAAKLSSRVHIYGGDIDPNCIGRYFVDHFWQMPHISELEERDLLSFCHQNNIRCIIPSRDGELAYFSRIKKTLAMNGISVMVSNIDTVSLCLDKLAFYEKFSKLGFPVIMTSDRIEGLGVHDRIVVKERYGAGSHHIGLNMAREQAMRHAERLENPIYQPYIEGHEVSIDVYVERNGSVKGVIARRRNMILNGESQITTTFRDNELEQLCKRFSESIPFYGHIVLQLLIDSAGRFHIIECNSRFGGASTLSVASGLDSFYWLLLECLGNDIREYPFIRSQKDKVQVRYPEDTVINGE
jgi:carbamoyl-phosphate synthase large subunit